MWIKMSMLNTRHLVADRSISVYTCLCTYDNYTTFKIITFFTFFVLVDE